VGLAAIHASASPPYCALTLYPCSSIHPFASSKRFRWAENRPYAYELGCGREGGIVRLSDLDELTTFGVTDVVIPCNVDRLVASSIVLLKS
jgi:hypothetical protein